MNCYVVVEGRVVEKEVYRVWIPEINGSLTYVSHPSELENDNFSIVSGNGYPSYFEIIESALIDAREDNRISRVVICVDSEEFTLAQKYAEIDSFIQQTGIVGVDYRIVVQHFCFEAWALGNRRIGSRNPKNPALAGYKRHYDVMKLDPEGLPSLPEKNMNRSQFAELYLRLMLNDKHKGLTYSKSDPSRVAHSKYFQQVRQRHLETMHLSSFAAFLNAFV